MVWAPVEIKLSEIVRTLGFSRPEKTFFQMALQNPNPAITYANHDRNLSVNAAYEIGLAENRAGLVIGPPLALRDYMAQVNAIIAVDAPDPEDMEQYLNKPWETEPSTEDEIRKGNLGVYTTASLSRDILRDSSLTIAQFTQLYKKLLEQKEEGLGLEDFKKQVKALLKRVHLDLRHQPIHITDKPSKDGPDFEGMTL